MMFTDSIQRSACFRSEISGIAEAAQQEYPSTPTDGVRRHDARPLCHKPELLPYGPLTDGPSSSATQRVSRQAVGVVIATIEGQVLSCCE